MVELGRRRWESKKETDYAAKEAREASTVEIKFNINNISYYLY
jgi:hypothetical protein